MQVKYEFCSLLGLYTVYNRSFVSRFGDNLSVPSAMFKRSKMIWRSEKPHLEMLNTHIWRS